MRKACVVLVSLFIGLGARCIVPSGVSEIINKGHSSKTNFTENNLENSEKIDESELYTNNINKTDNVNERSFKIFKMLYRNQLYKPIVPMISVQPVKKSDVRKNLPRKLKEAKKSPFQAKPYKQMFFPNAQNHEFQYIPSTYQYQYQGATLPYHNNSPVIDTTLDTTNLKNTQEEPTVTPDTSKQIVKNKIKYFIPYNKTNGLEYTAGPDKRLYKLFQKDGIKDFAINGPINANNMKIKSHTQRKPDKQSSKKNCGFLKPNQLHRATFNKKEYKESEKFSPVQIDGPNIDVSLDNINDEDDDEDLVRYIKDTLSGTRTNRMDKRSNPDCDNTEESNTKLISNKD